MFGGVTCSFKEEIRPFQSYEIWTRVLSWDQKWLYLVCHIVKKGAVKPKGYTLQPWQRGSKSELGSNDLELNGTAQEGIGPHPAILAVSVAKYVFKRGRKTIPPEDCLCVAELLPPKPEAHLGRQPPPMKAGVETPTIDESATENIVVDAVSSFVPDKEVLSPKIQVDFSRWDWDTIEAERLRGMEIAQHMGGLDQALNVWTADKETALGEF